VYSRSYPLCVGGSFTPVRPGWLSLLVSVPLCLTATLTWWAFGQAGGSLERIGTIRVDYRPIRGDYRPLRLRREDGTGFVYKCSECHRTFATSRRYPLPIAEHRNIQLQHGKNDYCLNCHHRTNRDAYVAHDGSEIPADRPAELCGKCHGLVYRDWQAGAHGRRQGYWDESRGERFRLLCIQCHDPHAPRFPKLAPLGGPHLARAPIREGEH